MFRDLSVRIKTEDIKRDLFACSGEIIDGLKKGLISVFKTADVIDCRFYRCFRKTFHSSNECISTRTKRQVVLDVSF